MSDEPQDSIYLYRFRQRIAGHSRPVRGRQPMITIQMIRWFVIWLLVFSAGLLLGSLAMASTTARTAFLLVAIFGTQVAVAVGWIAAHVAQLERGWRSMSRATPRRTQRRTWPNSCASPARCPHDSHSELPFVFVGAGGTKSSLIEQVLSIPVAVCGVTRSSAGKRHARRQKRQETPGFA